MIHYCHLQVLYVNKTITNKYRYLLARFLLSKYYIHKNRVGACFETCAHFGTAHCVAIALCVMRATRVVYARLIRLTCCTQLRDHTAFCKRQNGNRVRASQNVAPSSRASSIIIATPSAEPPPPPPLPPISNAIIIIIVSRIARSARCTSIYALCNGLQGQYKMYLESAFCSIDNAYMACAQSATLQLNNISGQYDINK